MKTNYHMLLDFDYKAEHSGFCTSEEMDMISNHFKLKERSDVELQNLRDFAVLFFGARMDEERGKGTRKYMDMADMMSAITGVIDFEKVARGMEV